MGSKTGKYNIEHQTSISKNKNPSSSLSSNLNESTPNDRSEKAARSFPICTRHEQLPDVFTSNTDHLTLVWLDSEMNTNLSNIDTKIKLRNLIDYLRIFDQVDACEQYIKHTGRTNNTEKLLVIISTTLASTLIPAIHHLPQVKYIYIYGKTKIDNATRQKLSTEYPKVKGVYSTSRSLLHRITEDKN